MRLPVWTALTLGLLAAVGPAMCAGQEIDAATRRLHPWGSFSPGAWKIVRIVTETLDEKGQVEGTSTTETKTTLDEVDHDGLALFVEGTVEMVGKRLAAEPRCVRQGFRGEPVQAGAKISQLEDATVVIEGRTIDCQVHQVQIITPTSKTTTKIYFSQTVAPYVLKTESATTDADGTTTLGRSEMAVVATDLPWKVLNEVKSTALVHAVQKHAKGRTDTWSVTSPDVPGGVIHHASKEVDQDGRLLRRSTLELIDYGSEPDNRISGPFRRLRGARVRKAHR